MALKMCNRPIWFYLALGFLLLGMFMEETEARRQILRGRKVLTRRYYRPKFLPAWAVPMIWALGIVAAGAALFFGLKMYVIDSIEGYEMPRYQPANTEETV